jgi:hypothetical protein
VARGKRGGACSFQAKYARITHCSFTKCTASDGLAFATEGSIEFSGHELGLNECNARYTESNAGMAFKAVDILKLRVVNISHCHVERHGAGLAAIGLKIRRMMVLADRFKFWKCSGHSIFRTTGFANSILKNSLLIENQAEEASIVIRGMILRWDNAEKMTLKNCTFIRNSVDLFTDIMINMMNCRFSQSIPDESMWYGQGNVILQPDDPDEPKILIAPIIASSVVAGVAVIIGIIGLIYWCRRRKNHDESDDEHDTARADVLNP